MSWPAAIAAGESEPAAEGRLVVILPAGLPLAATGETSVHDLATERLIGLAPAAAMKEQTRIGIHVVRKKEQTRIGIHVVRKKGQVLSGFAGHAIGHFRRKLTRTVKDGGRLHNGKRADPRDRPERQTITSG